ncbi:MAG: 16S rRNA (guanine(966)-N(2))-methyltransferase RsmD [Comamonas sp.]
MGRNSFRSIDEALALEARLRKREAFKKAEAEALAAAAGKKPGSKAFKPSKSAGGTGEVRIIGGQWRRTRLAVAQRPGLRPTPDRVRETLFNWLGQDLGGWRCIDAFAGTGALGLEAASRGASQVRMVEQDAGLAQQLEGLVQQLKAQGVQVQRGDGIASLTQSAPGHWHAIFIDPPFASEALFAPAIKAAAHAVTDDGFIYLEAPKAWEAEELAAYGLQQHRYLKAGNVHAHLLKKIAS